MRSFSAPTIAALEAGHVVFVWLVLLDFGTAGKFGFNTSNWNFEVEGETYYGAYGLGSISPVKDVAGNQVQGLQLELDGGPAERISLALDDADVVQGAPVTLRCMVLDADTYEVLEAPIEWQGYLDTMAVTEDGTSCRIGCTAESRAVDLLRGCPLTYTDADQQSIYPGDKAFEFVVTQADKPVVWPAKEWFYR